MAEGPPQAQQRRQAVMCVHDPPRGTTGRLEQNSRCQCPKGHVFSPFVLQYDEWFTVGFPLRNKCSQLSFQLYLGRGKLVGL